jgi:hypothetical protein
VSVNQYAQQIAQIRGDGTRPLTAEQERQITDIRARMKREMADPNVANRWNWNTPFILSQHNPAVWYAGADKLFRSVKRGLDAYAISPDLSARNPDWLRVASGFDADANPAPDASGGVTRDATGAEENATIVSIEESPVRAGLLYVGTDDGKVWLTRNDGGTWEDLSDRFPGVPPMTHVSKIDASRFDSATVYVARDNHRENDFTPYVYVSTDFGRTFRSIASNLPTDRPNSVYAIREDPVNPNLLYLGTELGVYASLNRGGSWFPLSNGLPTVPVYDLQVHPRDRELIAGTHGRSILVLDVAPLQQLTGDVLQKAVHLFTPTVAFQYAQLPPPSEPRAHRPWRVPGGPEGADIVYRLAATTSDSARIAIVDAAGDTVARMRGTPNAGLNRVSWNLLVSPGGTAVAGGRGFGGRFGGQGGPAVDVAGFPRGFNPRPAESGARPDTSASPTAPQVGRGGGRGFGGGGGGRGGAARPAETGWYRVVLDIGGQRQTQVLRVVRVGPGDVSVMAELATPGER